jgi:pyruvate,water dikinase
MCVDDFVPVIYFPDDASVPVQMGGKASALAALHQADLPIPPWFVLSPIAFSSLGALFSASNLALTEAVKRLCPNGELVAVRSSAVDEDGVSHSFAGQLDSYLFVDPHDVPKKATEVWRSGFSERIVSYRRKHNLPPVTQGPAILVQQMIASECSGVAFSADPVSGDLGLAVIGSVYGLGTSLVSGEVDADTFSVDRMGQIVRRQIAHKTIRHTMVPGDIDGIVSSSVSAKQSDEPSITDDQIKEIAALCRRSANHFGQPQDIEWAIKDDKIFLLQSRPITSLAGKADSGGVRIIWDNSNIVESYGGITTPLTFSFARKAYEEVYREFCRILGVSQHVIKENHDTFAQMIGLINGQIYYNLLNWYRTLSLLPGFKINRRFMEQMMGVREPLPPEIVQDLDNSSSGGRTADGFHFARTVFSLTISHYRLSKTIRRFNTRLNNALESGPFPLADMRIDELTKHYRDLERKLLKHWDAPLINDFFAMIHYGILRRIAKTAVSDEGLQNDLVSEQGGMVSAEPARLVREMAASISGEFAFIDLLCDGSLGAIRGQMPLQPEFKRLFEQYLEKFGDRTLGELKLESITLYDDPMLLLRSVGALARGKVSPETTNSPRTNRAKIAERKIVKGLHGNLFKIILFRVVLRNTRQKLRNRENLRFQRTRLFGHARRIFIEIGKRFTAAGILDDHRDIFYVEAEEILGFIEGTAATTNLKALAALRKEQFDSFRLLMQPADRFETFGAVNIGNAFSSEKPATISNADLKGIGCCPGTVRGKVRVVTDPRNAAMIPGEILVAERTDPGWIMLFASAAGLLVERGSLLSHSAIVSREMGIPSIVSIPGITQQLVTGDEVEMDGSLGTVSIISKVDDRVAN